MFIKKDEKRQITIISIIIPVYNVVEWLDQCMDSVINQTFTDFEVLLIDDGSTDGSDLKCDDWFQKDKRIRVFHKKHEGAWISRNFGIQKAEGKYLAFVDSDDWIDKQYIEKLYDRARKTDADIVGCDFWRFNNQTKEKSYRASYGHMGKEYSLQENIIYGEFVMWAYISKKTIWTENKIILPDCLGASHAVFILFLILGTKIAHVHEALYYYRRLRKGSLLDINGKGTIEDGIMGLTEVSYLIDELKKREFYKQNQCIIERAVKYRLSDLLAAQFSRKEDDGFDIQADNYYKYIDNYFPCSANIRYLNIGGYNLNRVLLHLSELHNPKCRFNFSSIISIMNPSSLETELKHKNRYRKIMIERDVSSSFWKQIESVEPQYIFVDFIEERFDVIRVSDGGFITKSDAFDEIENYEFSGKTIKRDSNECWEEWKKDWNIFCGQLQKYVPVSNIILIENYLSEKKGDIDSQEIYENINEIRQVNEMLKKYYEYAKQSCKGMTYVEAYKCKNYFTDKEYEYGAIPSHLNEVVNGDIARLIEKNLI